MDKIIIDPSGPLDPRFLTSEAESRQATDSMKENSVDTKMLDATKVAVREMLRAPEYDDDFIREMAEQFLGSPVPAKQVDELRVLINAVMKELVPHIDAAVTEVAARR